MSRILIGITITAVALLAASTIVTNAETFAEPGGPAGWYVAADTPAKKYRMLMKEAAAALKEALAECRAVADRRTCEREAREIFLSDVAEARNVLTQP